MRIGNRLGVAAIAAIIATSGATSVVGQDAVKRVQPVPLGGSLSGQTGEHHYGVYVPTKFGGELKVEATAGKVGPILGPDGKERANGQDVGGNAHGWYTFTVKDAGKPYSVWTS